MSKNGLKYPRLRVEMADGAEWEVQSLGPDQNRWEQTAVKQKWGSQQEVPTVWATFMAWHASRREGLLPSSITFEDFQYGEHRHSTISPVDEDADEDTDPDLGPGDVPPTGPAPGIG